MTDSPATKLYWRTRIKEADWTLQIAKSAATEIVTASAQLAINMRPKYLEIFILLLKLVPR